MKNKMFGIPVALFVIGLLVATSATAVLVSYLSNTTTASTDVSSPLKHYMSADGITYNDTTAPALTAFGGETKTVYLKVTDLANVAITGTPTYSIDSPGITCADLTLVKYYDLTTNPGVDITATCVVTGSTAAFTIAPVTFAVGDSDGKIEVTFAPAVTGTYTLTGLVTP